MSSQGVRRDNARMVRVIGAFRLAKGALLVGLGVGGLVAMPEQLVRAADGAVAWMGIFPGRDTLHRAIGRLSLLDHATVSRLAVLLLCYAAVFLIEGQGLLRGKYWAEWLTVIVTASFIPIEIYELVQHVSPAKVVALILNVSIGCYLAWRRVDRDAPSRQRPSVAARA